MRAGGWDPGLPVVVGAAALLVWRGRLGSAVALLVAAALLAQARALSPRVRVGVERATRASGRAVAVLVGGVLLGGAFVLVFVPVALARRVVRPSPAGGWEDRRALVDGPTPHRPFEHRVRPRRPVAPRLLAGVAGLLVLDLVAGVVLGGLGVLPDERGALVESHREAIDAWEDLPAMAGSPWAADYGEELIQHVATSPSQYLPFVGWRAADQQGRYLNVHDGVRASYQPVPPADVEPLDVAFFGGSTMFGFGQRDEHTIASAVARLAEEDGIILAVRNVSATGHLLWQELLDLESIVAAGEEPDLAVFYDGVNELSVQSESPSEDPTTFGVGDVRSAIERTQDDRYRQPGALDRLAELGEAYWATGAVGRAFGGADADVLVPAYQPTDAAAVERSLDVYRRGRVLVEQVADDGGVEVVFTWQPRRDPWPEGLVEALPDGTVDLTGSLDGHDDVWLDSTHHNEAAARVVAEALWAELEPTVRQLAAATGRGSSG